jgi:acetyl-CoA carboxylase carboxyl transferase subunit beta
MVWFKKPKYTEVRIAARKAVMTDGLWVKCEGCGEVVHTKKLDENLRVCPHCGFHFRMTGRERLAMLLDPDTWREMWPGIRSKNPLNFPEYDAKIKAGVDKTGLNEAILTGTGAIKGCPLALAVSDFRFMGASMGSAYGEKVSRLIEHGLVERLPVMIVSASGGARMQEGILSLMQMAKTSAALARLSDAGLLYISLLTNPTTGGVTASFAMLGDIIIAEPGALIGFAGPRVIEQTIRQRLPRGFQRSEFLLDHGMLDMIVPRAKLRDTIGQLLSYVRPGR